MEKGRRRPQGRAMAVPKSAEAGFRRHHHRSPHPNTTTICDVRAIGAQPEILQLEISMGARSANACQCVMSSYSLLLAGQLPAERLLLTPESRSFECPLICLSSLSFPKPASSCIFLLLYKLPSLCLVVQPSPVTP